MFNLELKDLISLGGAGITIVGAYFAVKYGQKESHRLLIAVHKRLDDIVKDVTDIKIKHAVLDERVSNLRQTGRFKLVPETQMFKDEE